MKYIKVYDEGHKLKDRIEKVKGIYSLTLFCYQAIEKEVERLEKKRG